MFDENKKNYDIFRILFRAPLTDGLNAKVFAKYCTDIDHIPQFIASKMRDLHGEQLRDYHPHLDPAEFRKITERILTPPTYDHLEKLFSESLGRVYGFFYVCINYGYALVRAFLTENFCTSTSALRHFVRSEFLIGREAHVEVQFCSK